MIGSSAFHPCACKRWRPHTAQSTSLACQNRSQRSKFLLKAAAAAAAAPAKPTAPHKVVLPQSAAPSRILFIGGIPAKVHAEQLEQQLVAVCDAAGVQPTRVQVVPFDSEQQRTRFPAGWLHKGFALLAFCDEGSVEAAAAAIRTQVPEWGPEATMGPALKAPAEWPANLTYTTEELSALQQQQACLDVRRAHNRRQRRRQGQRLIDSVEQLLSGLQQPFGQAAQQLYQPLVAPQACEQLQHAAAAAAGAGPNLQQAQTEATSDSSGGGCAWANLPPRLQEMIRWPVLTALLQQHHQQLQHQQLHSQQQPQQQQQQQQQPHRALLAGPIQLAGPGLQAAQVEAQLLLDWGQVPATLDPAFGGRLADADVVRAGRGRMNLRALRKRVQVESFALLLWQLTQQATHRPTTFSSSSSSSSGSSSSSSGSSSCQPLHVVEFGSGSGNLILPLAHLFPHFTFTAVDMKPSAVRLLQQRVQEVGLTNVTAQLGRIEDYTGTADVVLALHACGSATDWALAQAAGQQAAFIVSPCCIGKVNKHSSGGSSVSGATQQASTLESTALKQRHKQQQAQGVQASKFADANTGLQYPRSQQLQQQMAALANRIQQEHKQQLQAAQQSGEGAVLNKLQEAVLGSSSSSSSSGKSSSSSSNGGVLPVEQRRALFSILAATADYSHQEDHSHPELAGLAKTNVELDRGVCMQEAGYQVALVRLLQPELTAKSDVLVGVHYDSSRAGCAWQFGWSA